MTVRTMDGATVRFGGNLQGIAGKSLQKIEGLDVPSMEHGSVGKREA